MKNLLNLPGARVLSKGEQKSISGGGAQLQRCCNPLLECCTPNPGNFTGGPVSTCGSQYSCSFLSLQQLQSCCGACGFACA